MLKHILYATDLGLYGPYVLNQVARLSASTGAKVDILHVIEPMGVFAESIIDTYIDDGRKAYLREQGMAQVLDSIKRQVCDTLESDYQQDISNLVLGEVLVELGKPAETIIEQAKIRNADLIVLGSHGQHAYRGGLMGSVVTKVLQMSPIPIYMIPMVNLNSLSRS